MNEQMNEHIREDLIRLRDELKRSMVNDSTLAEVVLKINSCLFKGYPRREVSK